MVRTGKQLKTDEAICLSRRDFSETSLVVVFLCRQAGKVSVLAKGAKRPKSPLAVDLLDVGRALLLINPEGLGLLREFTADRGLPELRRDLRKWQAGLYLAELAGLATKDLAPAEELFDLLKQSLAEVSASGSQGALSLGLIGSARRMLAWAGYDPELQRCVGCGREMGPRDWLFFSASQGGLVCRDCEPAVVDKIRVEHRAWYALLGEVSDPVSTGKAFGLLNIMIGEHMGRSPRMSGHCEALFSVSAR